MRKLFGTDGVRGRANQYPITAEIAMKLGKAAAIVLRKNSRKPLFLIGKDTRLSGYMLENALTSGLTSMGADVHLVGPMPTPAVAHLVRSFAADAGIMISASHNPSEDNGIKFFDHRGLKLPDSTEEKIEKLVLEDELKTDHITDIGRAHRIDDAQGRYIEFVKGTINNISLEGLTVVLDVAHGAAYKVGPLILKELGAEVIVLNNQPNGKNINEDAGALHPEVVKEAVLKHKADVGMTLDGDADRIIMVDEKGNILDGDSILAIAATHMKNSKELKKNTVVVTSYSNLALDALLEEEGISVLRVKNGDRYVIEAMRKHGYNLGGEYSGHIIFGDRNPTGDGMVAGLQILSVMKETGKELSGLNNLKKYPQVLINVNVKEKRPLQDLAAVQQAIRTAEKELEGQGRHIVRYSGTENKARVMVEGKDKKKITEIAQRIADAIKEEVG